jgi:succinylglutamate desuccinylase
VPGHRFEIEIDPPDISPYRKGNTGIDYVTTLDSGRSGPHVMVNAVTHGNELCGAVVLDFLFRHKVVPTKGKLTLCFANFEAYLRFDPLHPTNSRFVSEDFNRLWSTDVLEGSRDSIELRRARKMRSLIDEVDFLLDLHSMQQRCESMIMAGPHPKGRDLAMSIGFPELIIIDSGHSAGRRLRDYKQFANPLDSRNSLLVECGQHWEENSAVVALDTTLRFLDHLDVIDPMFVERHIEARDTLPSPKVIEVTEAVTIKSSHFSFTADYAGLEIIEEPGTVFAQDGDEAIATPYDNCVLIMPLQRLQQGQTAVRLGRYVG